MKTVIYEATTNQQTPTKKDTSKQLYKNIDYDSDELIEIETHYNHDLGPKHPDILKTLKELKRKDEETIKMNIEELLTKMKISKSNIPNVKYIVKKFLKLLNKPEIPKSLFEDIEKVKKLIYSLPQSKQLEGLYILKKIGILIQINEEQINNINDVKKELKNTQMKNNKTYDLSSLSDFFDNPHQLKKRICLILDAFPNLSINELLKIKIVKKATIPKNIDFNYFMLQSKQLIINKQRYSHFDKHSSYDIPPKIMDTIENDKQYSFFLSLKNKPITPSTFSRYFKDMFNCSYRAYKKYNDE